MEKVFTEGGRQFKTPEEDLAFLRAEVARHEGEIKRAGERGGEKTPDKSASEVIKSYTKKSPETLLDPAFKLTNKETEAIVLELAPEAHDSKVEELLGLLTHKGIRNTLSVLKGLNDPHLEDDFHRFLVQYVKVGFPVEGLRERNPIFRALRMTLYEISLPEITEKEGEQKELKKFISGMEQFYAGMLSVSSPEERSQSYFTLEIANANGSDEFVFYASVPDGKRALFEKQILSIFPTAKVVEQKNDYNIFNETGAAVGSSLIFTKNHIFPIKLYEEFDVDPLNVILNSFSKIPKDGSGAAIQFLFAPAQGRYVEKYKRALYDIERGVPIRDAIEVPMTFVGDLFKGFKEILKNKQKTELEKNKVNQDVVESIKKKIGSPILSSNIRLVASAKNKADAEEILSHVESAFNQFGNTKGNTLVWDRSSGGKLKKLIRNFTWRLYDDRHELPLSIQELTTMMHFPAAPTKGATQLKQAKAGTAPAPLDLPKEGILLWVNRHRGMQVEVRMTADDRLRHFYTIGQTGTGKTTLLKNMIIQDIQNAE